MTKTITKKTPKTKQQPLPEFVYVVKMGMAGNSNPRIAKVKPTRETDSRFYVENDSIDILTGAYIWVDNFYPKTQAFSNIYDALTLMKNDLDRRSPKAQKDLIDLVTARIAVSVAMGLLFGDDKAGGIIS